MQSQIAILCPLFNDSASFNQLLLELKKSFRHIPDYHFRVLVVNDGSTEALSIEKVAGFRVQVLPLYRNIGHQKALAIGLAYIKDNYNCDKVLIMDADGEDRPEDALELLLISEKKPGQVIFAYRQSRQEGSGFRFFYSLYKLSFRILTGKKISFGNFMVMPKAVLDKIVFYSEIWNHLAGGILKSGLPWSPVQTHRGKRYSGTSKMNFSRLLMHGLGAIAVFMEVVASRLMIFSFSLIGFSLLVILILTGIKIFTDRAIPGWTSTLMSSMLVVLLQSFLLSLVTLFLYFSSESQRKFVPALHYKDFTGPVETIGE
ncbi:MAG: glycosyltransferase family 2 protein [Chitinophagaceae bacterium]|nr:glycosyltransferase family 2 protein [Chitinophagaceae bacterium]